MVTLIWPGNPVWPQWQKLLFRFSFIYFSLWALPGTIIELFRENDFISHYWLFENWIVNSANHYLFHSYEKLSNNDGSDSAYTWTLIRLYFLVALFICLIWSLLDRKRGNYNFLSYWFRILLRYFLIAMLFGYGIEKIFTGQMPFPNLNQLSLPLGDFRPQEVGWLSMGVAVKYQVFTGIVETLAGILMLYRRTATFGTLMALGAFTIVFMTNIGYDMQVKLFSLHLTIMCLVLLAYEYRRLSSFLLFNSTTVPNNLYNVSFSKRWLRITRILLMCVFFWQLFIMNIYVQSSIYSERQNQIRTNPITPGIYDVPVFVVNGDTIPPVLTDSLRWQKVVFNDAIDNGYAIPYDTIFWKRIDRGFFAYTVDTIKREIQFMKSKNAASDLYPSFLMKYELPDSNTIRLSGLIRKDSVLAVLKNTHRHFILTDSKMQWLKENR